MLNFTKSVFFQSNHISLRFSFLAIYFLLFSFFFGQLQAQTVSIANSHAGLSVKAGDVITYTVTVTNNSNSIMNSVIISDPVPAAPAVFVPNSLLVGGSNLTCSVPSTITNAILISGFSLLPEESLIYRFQVKISETYSGTTTVSHTATAGGSATTSNTVSAIPALSLVKSGTTDVSSGTVNKGGLIYYKIEITNTGTATANSVVFKDKLDLTKVNLIGVNDVLVTQNYKGSYTVNKGNAIADDSVRVSLGDMPMGASATIKFTIRTKSPFPGGVTAITNTATATSSNLTAGTSTGTVSSNTTSHSVNNGPSCANRDIYYLSFAGNDASAEVNNPNKAWKSFVEVMIAINSANGNAVLRFQDAHYPASVSGLTSTPAVLQKPCVTIDGNYCIFDAGGASISFLKILKGADGDTIKNLRMSDFNASPDMVLIQGNGITSGTTLDNLVIDNLDIYSTASVKATSISYATNLKFKNCDWSSNPFGAIDIKDSKIEFTDCGFYCNTRGGYGGAVNISENSSTANRTFCDIKFIGGEFNKNSGTGSAGDGGAIYCDVGKLTIDGTKFVCNSTASTTGGGAVRVGAASSSSGYPIVSIKNAVFSGNSATSGAGSAVLRSGSAGSFGIENTIFKGNSSQSSVLETNGNNMTVKNCIFTDNTGSGAVAINAAPALVENTTITNNSAGVSGTIASLVNSKICGNTGTNMTAHPTSVTNSVYGRYLETITNSSLTITNPATLQGSYTFTEGTNATFLENDANSATAGYVFTNAVSGDKLNEAATSQGSYTFTNNSTLLHSMNPATTLAAVAPQAAYTSTNAVQTIYTNNTNTQGTAVFGYGVSQVATGGVTGGYWRIGNTTFTDNTDLQGSAAFGAGVTQEATGGVTGGYWKIGSLNFSNNCDAQGLAVFGTGVTSSSGGVTGNYWRLSSTGTVELPLTGLDLSQVSAATISYSALSINNTTNPASQVKIEVSSDGGATWTAATATSTATTTTWTATSALLITGLTNNMRLRFSKVTAANDDVGVDNISVIYAGRVELPLTGLDLSAASGATIVYSALSINNTANPTSNIKIEVSSDGGTTWTAATATSTATSTTWTATPSLAITGLTNNMRLRFSKVTITNDDVGLDNIIITYSGYLEVPVSNDLSGLTTVNIQYKKLSIDNTANSTSNIRLEISSDGGTTWTAAVAQSTATTTTWAATTALSITSLSNAIKLRLSKVTLLNDDVGADDFSITYDNAIQQTNYWLLDPTETVSNSANTNLTNYANPEVSFDIASVGNTGINPTGKFEYSTNGGTSWTVATSTLNPTSSTFVRVGPFPISASTATFRMRFTATNTSGNSLAIDSVVINYDNNIQQTADWLLDQDDVIESSNIDLTGFSSVSLQYQQYSPASAPYNNSGTTQSKVSFEYSLDGGTSWTAGTLPTAAATTTLANAFTSPQTITLGSSAITNFRLRFKNAKSGNKSVAVDNIVLTSTPIQQAGYWLLEQNDVIVTGAMNLTGISSVSVQYDIAGYGTQSTYQYGTLEYSLNNGTTWSAVTNTQTPTSTSLPNITAFASPLTIALGGTSVTQFKLRFKHNGLAGKALQIDNLLISYATSQNIQQAGAGSGGAAGFWLLEQADVITSNNIDLSGLANVMVHYQIAASGVGPLTKVKSIFEYSLNGGSTWSAPAIDSTTSTSYTTTPIKNIGNGVSNFRMRFRHDGTFGKILSIDNIIIAYDQAISCGSNSVGSTLAVGTYPCLTVCPVAPSTANLCITFSDLGNLSLSGCKFLNTYTENFADGSLVNTKLQAGQSFTALLSNFVPVSSPANAFKWRYLVVNPSGTIITVVTPTGHATLSQITNTTITPTFPVGVQVVSGTYKVYGYYYNQNIISAPTAGTVLSSLAGNDCGSLSKNYAEFEILKPIVETVTAACADLEVNTCPNRYIGTVTITGGYPEYANSKGFSVPQYIIGADKTYAPTTYTNEMTGWVSYGTPANYMNSYVSGQSFGVKTEDDGNCTTYPYALDVAVFATPTTCSISIAGNVLYDRNGANISGYGINKVNGLPLYAYLVSNTGAPCVVAKTTVNSNGTYTFTQNFSPNTYKIYLSTNPNAAIGATGAALPSVSLPTTGTNGAWSNTAEGLVAGSDSTGDGNANGILNEIIVSSTSNITGANFALNSMIPLPANLLLFDGQLSENDANIFWLTTQEQNISSFKIEHSIDGLAFSEVGSVEAVSNSNTQNEYQFKHYNIPLGKNYYRLKIVDIDGKEVYSDGIVVLEKGKSDNLMLYPNPAHNSVTVEHPISTRKGKVKMVDASGRIVKTEEIAPYTAKINISLEGIEPGVYMLIWNGELMQKLIIY